MGVFVGSSSLALSEGVSWSTALDATGARREVHGNRHCRDSCGVLKCVVRGGTRLVVT